MAGKLAFILIFILSTFVIVSFASGEPATRPSLQVHVTDADGNPFGPACGDLHEPDRRRTTSYRRGRQCRIDIAQWEKVKRLSSCFRPMCRGMPRHGFSGITRRRVRKLSHRRTSTFALSRGRSISGKVINEQGRPIAAAKVKIFFDETDLTRNQGLEAGKITERAWRCMQTDRDGIWRCDTAPQHWWKADLEPSHPDYFSPNYMMEIGTDKSVTSGQLTTTMTRGRSVAGRVMDSSGRPVSGCACHARKRLSRPLRKGGERSGGTICISTCRSATDGHSC